MNDEFSLTTKIIGIGIIVVSILLFFMFIAGIFFGVGYSIRVYDVWASGMIGKAELQKADWNRQIIVREAEAKKDSAIYLAQAEIERAKGVAQANKIIGDSLKENENYLRYLWIDHLQNEKNQVIYVPTEANLPILEAQRLKVKK